MTTKTAFRKDFFIQSRKEDIKSIYKFQHKVRFESFSPSDAEDMVPFTRLHSSSLLTLKGVSRSSTRGSSKTPTSFKIRSRFWVSWIIPTLIGSMRPTRTKAISTWLMSTYWLIKSLRRRLALWSNRWMRMFPRAQSSTNFHPNGEDSQIPTPSEDLSPRLEGREFLVQ